MTVTTDQRAVARVGLVESYRTSHRTTWIEATGRSMQPSIPAGSDLLVEFGRLPERRGDLIVFRRGDALVAHRLVGRQPSADGGRLIARGDAEAFFDPPLHEADVLGVVRLVRLPHGPSEDVVGSPRRNASIAIVSWWSGRAAGVAVRLVRRIPGPSHLRRAATSALVGLSRVPTRVVSEALPRPPRGQARGRR